MLSSAAFAGIFAPTISAAVAMKSVRHTMSALLVPGFTFPGQLTMNGTRCPPSKMSALCPRKPALGSCPFARSSSNFASGEHPLSLVRMTTVSFATPASSSAASTVPSAASTCITKSPYAFSPLLSFHSGSGLMGVCGAFSGR